MNRTSSPQEAPWTVARILDWTVQHLKQHGSETPRLDAEILLAHARHCPRIQLYVSYHDLVTDTERAAMRELVRRRARAEPVAYLVGHREFFGLDLHVSADVLIPRPETETLVLELLDLARSLPNPTILDVGTGSGCIAAAAAANLARAHVTAIDISPPALVVARENAARLGLADRIDFLEGDLVAPVPPGKQFDFIVSNPPYVADCEMESLPPDVRNHEPHLALRAGADGLSIITRLIAAVPPLVRTGGGLLLEIAPEQAAAVRAQLQSSGCFVAVKTLKDGAGSERVVRALRASP